METETININDVVVIDRARKDLGDIPAMIASIKEFGIIQPIVIGDGNELIAGGRRLEAMRQMGMTTLNHAEHWVRRDETSATEEGKLRLKSMELEENLRRKDMAWPEVIAAKKKLLEIMEKIHGPQSLGGLTREELRTGVTTGFGVRKLAAMLGESPASTSQDLKLAAMVEQMPQLKNTTSKEVAGRTALGMILSAAVQKGLIKPVDAGKAATAVGSATATMKPLEYRVMVFCKDEVDQADVMAEFLKRGYKCQAVIV